MRLNDDTTGMRERPGRQLADEVAGTASVWTTSGRQPPQLVGAAAGRPSARCGRPPAAAARGRPRGCRPARAAAAARRARTAARRAGRSGRPWPSTSSTSRRSGAAGRGERVDDVHDPHAIATAVRVRRVGHADDACGQVGTPRRPSRSTAASVASWVSIAGEPVDPPGHHARPAAGVRRVAMIAPSGPRRGELEVAAVVVVVAVHEEHRHPAGDERRRARDGSRGSATPGSASARPGRTAVAGRRPRRAPGPCGPGPAGGPGSAARAHACLRWPAGRASTTAAGRAGGRPRSRAPAARAAPPRPPRRPPAAYDSAVRAPKQLPTSTGRRPSFRDPVADRLERPRRTAGRGGRPPRSARRSRPRRGS